MNPTILTVSGNYFNFLRPEAADFTIEDIAHALSNICRFTGHVKSFYSVAQHSVLVSRLVPAEHALAGLLHDAAEAFLGDVSSPLKMLLNDYKEIERCVEKEVLGRFGLSSDLHPEVKHADLRALATEKRDLMAIGASEEWSVLNGVTPDLAAVVPLSPGAAYHLFMGRFSALTDAGVAYG